MHLLCGWSGGWDKFLFENRHWLRFSNKFYRVLRDRLVGLLRLFAIRRTGTVSEGCAKSALSPVLWIGGKDAFTPGRRTFNHDRSA